MPYNRVLNEEKTHTRTEKIWRNFTKTTVHAVPYNRVVSEYIAEKLEKHKNLYLLEHEAKEGYIK